VVGGSASHGVSLLEPAVEPKAAQLSALVPGFVRDHTAA